MKVCWSCGDSVPDTYRYCLACGADVDASAAEPVDPMLGQTIVGKYKLSEVIGSGAMGTIYRAEQLNLSKTIVIKLLHRHLLTDAELTHRFQLEARAASRLNHKNCIQIIDFGQTEGGSLFIAMEHIPGDDLATLLERGHPLDLRRIIKIMKQVCEALDEAHANGVLHRDLKPENIMVYDHRSDHDRVKVVDFGIAKLEDNNPKSSRSFKTRTGIVCGTPEYMSPEQARGKKLDARSDIYALGVALYHLVTDRLPFDAASPIEIVTKHLTEEPRPPSELRADLPETFERLILTMMSKDRRKRPTSVMDVHAELDRIDRELAYSRRDPVEQKRDYDATVVDVRRSALLRAIADARESPTDRSPKELITGSKDRATPAPSNAPARQLPSVGLSSGLVPVSAAESDRRSARLARHQAERRDRQEQVTVDVTKLSGAATPSEAPATPGEPEPPTRRRAWLWIGLALGAIAVGVGAWALAAALQ